MAMLLLCRAKQAGLLSDVVCPQQELVVVAMKRKTAMCKCGRTVESTTVLHRWWSNPEIGDGIAEDLAYRILCPCGIKTTTVFYSPIGAWAEWKRLQEQKP
jgi:hypothetical protein